MIRARLTRAAARDRRGGRDAPARVGRHASLALYYYGYRYLDTQLGRWLSSDPAQPMVAR